MGSVSKDGSFLTHKTTDIRADVLRTGDLVMPKDDIGGGQIIGKAVLVVEDERYVLGDHVYRLRLTDGFPAFVRYAINSFKVNTQLRSKVVGSAQLGLGRRSVLEQPISMPPLKEQQAIAEALTNADAAIESLDALITKKRDIKQATMQHLLTGRIRLPGFTANWEVVRLGSLLSYEQPTEFLVSSSNYIEGGQVPVLTAGKSFLLGYTEDSNGIYKDLPTILFDDFTTATQWVDFEFKVKSSACKMLKPKSDACDLRYVYQRLRALDYRTSDHKRHWISVFHSMEMLMPPLKEQEAIADALSVIDEELEALTKQVTKLQMVKEGMMQDLLTGKVRMV